MIKEYFAILLSIKPRFVEQIFSKKKTYEFRKQLWKNCRNLELSDIKIYIYSTSPVKKIVGYFKSLWIYETDPHTLWEKCRIGAGIDWFEFREYFKDYEKGFAIWIKNLNKFVEPISPFCIFSEFHAPMNFIYIRNKTVLQYLEKREVEGKNV